MHRYLHPSWYHIPVHIPPRSPSLAKQHHPGPGKATRPCCTPHTGSLCAPHALQGCRALCIDVMAQEKGKINLYKWCEWAGGKLEAASLWLGAEQVQLTISSLFPASSFSFSRLFRTLNIQLMTEWLHRALGAPFPRVQAPAGVAREGNGGRSASSSSSPPPPSTATSQARRAPVLC